MTVLTGTQYAEIPGAESILQFLDPTQGLRSDHDPDRNPRGETRGGGFVGKGQTPGAGPGAHPGLAPTRLAQGSADAAFAGGASTGSIGGVVVRVLPVEEGPSPRPGQRRGRGEQSYS